jgi:hypothetical protein
MPTREVMHDGLQIMMAPLGSQLALWRARRHETRSVFVHETVDRRGCPTIAVTQIVAYGIEDVLIRHQKHVMQANLEPVVPRSGGKHGAPVVGHHESDRLPQALRQAPAPFRGSGIGSVQLILTTLENIAPWSRLRFVSELEGKL